MFKKLAMVRLSVAGLMFVVSTSAFGIDPVVPGNLDVSATVYSADSVIKNQGDLRLREGTAGGTNYTGFQAPATLADDYLYTMPNDDGDSGEVLSTDGSGVLSWAATLTNPMTAANDIIVGGAAGAPTRVDADLIGDVSASITSATVTFDETGGTVEDMVEWASHGLPNWDRVFFTNSGGALPTGISANTLYYVRNAAAGYFQISATASGAIVTLTGDGSGTSTGYAGGLKIKSDVPVSASASLSSDASYDGSTAATIVFDAEEHDTHGAYNTATGEYTCPITGKYVASYVGVFKASTSADETGAYANVHLFIDGTKSGYLGGSKWIADVGTDGDVEWAPSSGSVSFTCTAGQVVTIRVEESLTSEVTVDGGASTGRNTNFYIYKL